MPRTKKLGKRSSSVGSNSNKKKAKGGNQAVPSSAPQKKNSTRSKRRSSSVSSSASRKRKGSNNNGEYGPPKQSWNLSSYMLDSGGSATKKKKRKRSSLQQQASKQHQQQQPEAKKQRRNSSVKKFVLKLPPVDHFTTQKSPWQKKNTPQQKSSRQSVKSTNNKQPQPLQKICNMMSVNGDMLEALNEELQQFATYVQLSHPERLARDYLIHDIQQVSKGLFEKHSQSKISHQVFGSFATQAVCTFESDIDLALWGVVENDDHNDHDDDDDDEATRTTTIMTNRQPPPPPSQDEKEEEEEKVEARRPPVVRHPNRAKQEKVLKWKSVMDDLALEYSLKNGNNNNKTAKTTEATNDDDDDKKKKNPEVIVIDDDTSQVKDDKKPSPKKIVNSNTPIVPATMATPPTATTEGQQEDLLFVIDREGDDDDDDDNNDENCKPTTATKDDENATSSSSDTTPVVTDCSKEEPVEVEDDDDDIVVVPGIPLETVVVEQPATAATKPNHGSMENPIQVDKYDDDSDDEASDDNIMNDIEFDVGDDDEDSDSDDDTADKLEGLQEKFADEDDDVEDENDYAGVVGNNDENDEDEDDKEAFSLLNLPDAEEDLALKSILHPMTSSTARQKPADEEEEEVPIMTRPRSHSHISLCSATTCSDTELLDESGMEVSFITEPRNPPVRRPVRTSSATSTSSNTTTFGPTGETRVLVVRALNKLSKKLWKSPWMRNLYLRKHARVPIINFETCFGCECDIAIGGHNGTDTSSYAAAQCARFKSFATVVLFLKVLLSQQDLDKPFTGGIGSFKLYVLVAHHIEKHLALGGNDNPAEVLFMFLFRYGDCPGFNGINHSSRTALSQYVVINSAGGTADLSSVYQIENCVKVFQSCWLRLRNKLKTQPASLQSQDRNTSILRLLVNSSELELKRNSRSRQAALIANYSLPKHLSATGRAGLPNSRRTSPERNQPQPDFFEPTQLETDDEAEQLKAGYGLASVTNKKKKKRSRNTAKNKDERKKTKKAKSDATLEERMFFSDEKIPSQREPKRRKSAKK